MPASTLEEFTGKPLAQITPEESGEFWDQRALDEPEALEFVCDGCGNQVITGPAGGVLTCDCARTAGITTYAWRYSRRVLMPDHMLV